MNAVFSIFLSLMLMISSFVHAETNAERAERLIHELSQKRAELTLLEKEFDERKATLVEIAVGAAFWGSIGGGLYYIGRQGAENQVVAYIGTLVLKGTGIVVGTAGGYQSWKIYLNRQEIVILKQIIQNKEAQLAASLNALKELEKN